MDTATTVIYTLSLHDALPILPRAPANTASAARPVEQHQHPRPRHDQERRHPVHERRAAVVLAEVVDHARSEEHTSELQSQFHLVCRLLLEKKNRTRTGSPARN